MKTLVIRGASPLPETLREVITRGSTSVSERRVADVANEEPRLDADRIVFWADAADHQVRAVAERYVRAEQAERKEKLVFVTTDGATAAAGLAPAECFTWPRDEDRLTMAFMTGA
jgi:hypothetical protein